MKVKSICMASVAAMMSVSFGATAYAQENSSPEVHAWLQKAFPAEGSAGHRLISPNVLEKSGSWYCGGDSEKFSCHTVTVFPSMTISVSKRGGFEVSLTPPARALKDAENINDISLNFSNGDTVYIRHSWDFDREGDDIRSFVHALTSSKNVSLTFNGDMQSWTLPLSGTSRAVDSMAFWAAEHHVSLPFPFYQAEAAEVGEDGAVNFHAALPPSSNVKHEQSESGSALPVKDTAAALEKPSGSCHDNWKACKDTADLAHNWNGFTRVIAKCVIKGNEIARYGTPKWGSGWFSGPSFSSYMQGDDAPENGILALFEPHANLQNQYGTWVHREAMCVYNLNKEKISSLSIRPEENAPGGMEGEELIEPYEDQSATLGADGR